MSLGLLLSVLFFSLSSGTVLDPCDCCQQDVLNLNCLTLKVDCRQCHPLVLPPPPPPINRFCLECCIPDGPRSRLCDLMRIDCKTCSPTLPMLGDACRCCGDRRPLPNYCSFTNVNCDNCPKLESREKCKCCLAFKKPAACAYYKVDCDRECFVADFGLPPVTS